LNYVSKDLIDKAFVGMCVFTLTLPITGITTIYMEVDAFGIFGMRFFKIQTYHTIWFICFYIVRITLVASLCICWGRSIGIGSYLVMSTIVIYVEEIFHGLKLITKRKGGLGLIKRRYDILVILLHYLQFVQQNLTGFYGCGGVLCIFLIFFTLTGYSKMEPGLYFTFAFLVICGLSILLVSATILQFVNDLSMSYKRECYLKPVEYSRKGYLMNLRAFKDLRIYSAIGQTNLFYFKVSTKSTIYEVITNYTLTMLMSVP